MMPKPCFSIRSAVCLSLIMAGMGTLPAEAEFPLPREDVFPFRRDRIALPLDQQQQLADQLILLGKGLPSDTAAQRRSKAQALALALAVYPGREEARNELMKLSKTLVVATGAGGQVDMAFIGKIRSWLDSRPDEDNQALAACLEDLLHMGQDDVIGATAWANWIPEETAYETEPPKLEEISSASVEPTPAPVVKEKDPFKLSEARLDVLVTLLDQASGNKSRLVLHLGMKSAPSQGFGLVGNMGRSVAQLRSILEKRHPDLAKGTISLTLQTRKGDITPKAGEVSAAAFVLADAAFTGKEPEALVMGQISNETYQLPPDFWASLNAVEDQEHPGRLILPTAAAEYLPALLVLNKPEFFLKHEVCLASSPEELIELAAKSLTDEAAATAHRRFAALMAQAKNVPVSSLLADPRVRLQLEEIGRALPYHASARILAIQAAGKRPAFLPHKVTVAAIQDALEPMDWAGKSEHFPDFNKVPEILNAYDDSRKRLVIFEKLVDPSESSLVVEFNDVLLKFRVLSRAYKSREVDYSGSTVEISKAFLAFTKSYETMEEYLKAAEKGG